jgi:GNAT superfamily N-acetyltransferase
MPTVDEKVYYLEMLAHAKRIVPAPREGLTILHAKKPSVAYYRFLYQSVGKDYHWQSRGKLSDAEMAQVLNSTTNEVHVMHVDGCPAGFTELDRRQPDDVELVQFGLMPGYIGQGLGKYLLQWTIDKVWSAGPRRLWLHTCSLDHPNALPNYLKAGFIQFKEVAKKREL